MIRAFLTPSGDRVGINPAMVLAIVAQGNNTLIVMGHSYSYTVTDPIEETLRRLNFVEGPDDSPA